jgi:hypothetical protein
MHIADGLTHLEEALVLLYGCLVFA